MAAYVIFHVIKPVGLGPANPTHEGVLDASCLQVGSLDLEKVASDPLLVLEARIDHLVLYIDADIFVLSIYIASFCNCLFRLELGRMIINVDVIKFTNFSLLLF